MAITSLRETTTTWIVGGFLLTALLSFAILFMFANNPTGLDGDGTGSILGEVHTTQTNTLLEAPVDADVLLNITSNTNPEVSDLGSRDSVAAAYSATGQSKVTFQQTKKLIGWVFAGDTGKLLLGVLGGLIGMLAFFFISKFIRQGS